MATVVTELMVFQVCNKGCENTHAISMGNGLATKGGQELISFHSILRGEVQFSEVPGCSLIDWSTLYQNKILRHAPHRDTLSNNTVVPIAHSMHAEFVIRLLIGETEGVITIKYYLKKKVINFHF